MNKRKTVLSALAIFAGLVIIYIFLSTGASGRTSSTSNPANGDSASSNGETAKPPDSTVVPFDENKPLKANEQAKGSIKATVPQEKSLTGTAVELALYLILIFALVVGLLVFIKKIIPGGHRIFDSQAIEVLGKAHLAPKQAIYLARVGARVLVLGVAEQSINVLAEIHDPEEINNLKAQAAQGKVDSVTTAFKAIFKRKDAEFAAGADKSDKGVQQGLNKIQSLVDKWHKSYSQEQK